MLVLPKNLGLLAGIAGDESRYALSAVHVVEHQADWYRLEATDGKRLAVICGDGSVGPAADGAQIAGRLAEAPNGATEGLVPAAVWRKAFQGVAKGGRIGLALAENQATLATLDTSTTTPLLDGRFPAVDLVLPLTRPLFRLMVNPEFLRDLLGLALAIDPEGRRVELLYYKAGGPIGLMARNAEGQTLDALLMPLT